MIKRLIQNTVISTVAFGAAAVLGLIVIPVIIRTWGVTEFGLIVIAAFMLWPLMSKDFLPTFREETALVSATAAPGTSLDEMNRISDVIESELLTIPEVKKVGRRLGRARLDGDDRAS